jgi:hypothetical protein
MKLFYSHGLWEESNSLKVSLNENDIVELTASCNVRNELNGRRKDNQVVKSMPDNVPYQPRKMPIGLWEIGTPLKRYQEDRFPYFIPCNAIQELPIWVLNEYGYYEQPTSQMTIDKGYGIHCSTWQTTLGCIKMHITKELLMLVYLINYEKQVGNKIYMEVTE